MLDAAAIQRWQGEGAEETLCADVGDVILMRPLLLHASSAATRPGNRRVLHLVFAETTPALVRWQVAA